MQARPRTGFSDVRASCRDRRHPGHTRNPFTAGHHLHHLLRIGELLEQSVHVLGGGARPGRDSFAAAAADDLGVRPFVRGHRADDRLYPSEVLVVDIDIAKCRTGARQHSKNVLERPHPLQHLELVEEVLQIELAFLHLPGGLLGLLLVEGLLGLFDERQHVAHAENPPRHPIGMERLEVVEALAETGELDRDAGDLTDRDRRTSTGIAVELGQHDSGHIGLLGEALRATLTAS